MDGGRSTLVREGSRGWPGGWRKEILSLLLESLDDGGRVEIT